MVPAKLSKDIEVEVLFTKHPKNGDEILDTESKSTCFIFDDVDLWRVTLWQDESDQIFPIDTPTRFFVEFEFPQSLSGKLIQGKTFTVWESEIIGSGIILEILNLEERAQENIEYIVQRPRDEVSQILDFIKSLCGEPAFNDIDKNFYQKLKIALGMDGFKNYLWLWEKPRCSHVYVEFDSPKQIPKIKQLLPNNPTPIWFLVDIDWLLSAWFLYSATFTTLEDILQKYKFSQYYLVAKDFSWVIRKINKQFIAIGNEVENRLTQSQNV